MSKKKNKKPKSKGDPGAKFTDGWKGKPELQVEDGGAQQTKKKKKRNGRAKKPLQTLDANEALPVPLDHRLKAKSKATKPQCRDTVTKTAGIMAETWDLVRSATRLHEVGFDPNVTDLSPCEYLKKWTRLAEVRQHKPTIEQLYGDLPEGVISKIHAGLKRQGLNDCDIFFHPDRFFRRKDSLDEDEAEQGVDERNVTSQCDSVENENLANILSVLSQVDVGQPIDFQIFIKGLGAVKAMALSSKGIWKHIATSINIWNFPDQSLAAKGFSPIFVAVNREFDIQQFRRSKDLLLVMPEDNVPSREMRERVQKFEDDMLKEMLFDRHTLKNKGGKHPPKGLDSYWDLLKRIPIKTVNRIMLESQFVSTMPDHAKFEQGDFLNGGCLRMLIRELHSRRESLKVLYLCEIPLIDHSLLAVILRGLPKVTVVGIYDCPLLGFSDLLSILDIIHTVNQDRFLADLPKITSFDFRPFFESGQAADWTDRKGSYEAAEYGISWEPIRLEIWQRGFYGTLMRAVIKARSMGLKLLFDKDGAFQDFLFRVPNMPLGVPTFLDGLYRWMKLTKAHGPEHPEIKKALFDMLKPVCTNIDSRWNESLSSKSHWYEAKMGQEMYECYNCGMSTLPEFFRLPGLRVCAVCELERDLRGQLHHHMLVRECPKAFYSHIDNSEFEANDEAPIPRHAMSLLKRTHAARSKYAPSVRQLRTLEELARTGVDALYEFWQTFFSMCECLDYRVRVVRLGLRTGYFTTKHPSPMCPHGPPGGWQHQPRGSHKHCRSWAAAIEAHKEDMLKGWVPGSKPQPRASPRNIW